MKTLEKDPFKEMVQKLKRDSQGLLCPSNPEESVKYDSPFYVVGVQLVDIDGRVFRNNNYDIFPNFYELQGEEFVNKLWNSFKTFQELKRRKEEISEFYARCFTSMFPKRTPIKGAIRLIVHYMGLPGNYIWRI